MHSNLAAGALRAVTRLILPLTLVAAALALLAPSSAVDSDTASWLTRAD